MSRIEHHFITDEKGRKIYSHTYVFETPKGADKTSIIEVVHSIIKVRKVTYTPVR